MIIDNENYDYDCHLQSMTMNKMLVRAMITIMSDYDDDGDNDDWELDIFK